MGDWVKMSERKPKLDDCDSDLCVVAIADRPTNSMFFLNVARAQMNDATHWMPFVPPPKEITWRPATIQDLAAAGKPIPARFRATVDSVWMHRSLVSVSLLESEALPFMDDTGFSWHLCEVHDA